MKTNDLTITQVFARTVAEYGDNPAFYFIDKSFSYKEYDGLSNQVANALLRSGIRKGDRVAINLPNLPQFLVFMIGALKVGCIISGLTPLATADEAEAQLKNLQPTVLISFDAVYTETVRRRAVALDFLKLIVITRPLDLMPGVLRFLAWVTQKIPHPHLALTDGREIMFLDFLTKGAASSVSVETQASDVAAILYTGGTTGVAKGVMLSHANLLVNIDQGRQVTEPQPGVETGLSIFPFFHIAGLTAAFNTIVIGGAWVLIPNPRDLDFIIKQFRKYRPSLIFAVPLLYQRLLEKRDFQTLDFSCLKFVMSGATAMPQWLLQRLEELTRVPVLEGYGMTEASPGLTINYPGFVRHGTVGQALPHTQLKTIALDDARELGVGEEGELIAAGPQVMQGYFNNAAETASTVKERGGVRWLHTGDVARIDAEGYVTIVDRIKDMVNVSGYKVFSNEVEEVVRGHAAVEACAVLAEPTPDKTSETVQLVVQVKNEFVARAHAMLRAELTAFCRERLAAYKVPKSIEFIDAMPLTPIGKVDKKTLRNSLRSQS
ncbi:MAG: AMP-binding protein [Spirochaetes bacterium]|nr:AMP-binding protein [Spirochaetota bacterium]